MSIRRPVSDWLPYGLSLVLAVTGVLVAAVAFAQQPNIVIINLDDMGWGDFGVYGSAHSQTPNINALASQGTRFTQYYSGAPICSPSRASLIHRASMRLAPISTRLSTTRRRI